MHCHLAFIVVALLAPVALSLPGTCVPTADPHVAVTPAPARTIAIPSSEKGVTIEGALYMPAAPAAAMPVMAGQALPVQALAGTYVQMDAQGAVDARDIVMAVINGTLVASCGCEWKNAFGGTFNGSTIAGMMFLDGTDGPVSALVSADAADTARVGHIVWSNGAIWVPQARPAKPPLLVMAHGLGGRKWAGITLMADRFAREAGYAALAFDYRRTGNSGGAPALVYDPSAMAADYTSVVQYARASLGDAVDTSRIVVWSTCFGAGAAAVALSKLQDEGVEVAAYIAQTPFLDLKDAAVLTSLSAAQLAWVASAASLDVVTHKTGIREAPSLSAPHDKHVLLPLWGTGVITPPAQMDIDGGNSSSRGCLPARLMTHVADIVRYPHFQKVRAPTLLLHAKYDQVTQGQARSEAILKAKAGGNNQFRLLESEHMSVYPMQNEEYYQRAEPLMTTPQLSYMPEAYNETFAAQVAFLLSVL